MNTEYNMTCLDCHGGLSQLAQNPNPWLNEPRCDSSGCHGNEARQDKALYRLSKGHGYVYCEACHDSPHAIAPSREYNDRIKFINLQGEAEGEGLKECRVCHGTEPAGDFRHIPAQTATPMPSPTASRTPTELPSPTATATAVPTSSPTPTLALGSPLALPLILRGLP